MTEAVAAVEIDGVTKRFGEVTAVDNLDLSIGDGEFFALLGPSGCGKTTTLRMIAGLDFPSEGRLRIFGDDVEREVGITFVFVTHDQEEALTMSDRVAILDAGRLLQVGTPEEVYEKPANRFVADFIGRANLLEATVKSPHEICLANGSMVACGTDHPAGTKVALSLRSERADLIPQQADPPGGRALPCINGRSTSTRSCSTSSPRSTAWAGPSAPTTPTRPCSRSSPRATADTT